MKNLKIVGIILSMFMISAGIVLLFLKPVPPFWSEMHLYSFVAFMFVMPMIFLTFFFVLLDNESEGMKKLKKDYMVIAIKHKCMIEDNKKLKSNEKEKDTSLSAVYEIACDMLKQIDECDKCPGSNLIKVQPDVLKRAFTDIKNSIKLIYH